MRELRTRAHPLARGVIQAIFTRGNQVFDEARQRVSRGRRGNLIPRQPHSLAARRCLQHLIDKIIRPRAVQPRRTHDHMLIRQLTHQLFARVFAFTVHGDRVRIVKFAERRASRAVKHIIS